MKSHFHFYCRDAASRMSSECKMQVLQFCRVAIEDGEAILSNDSANDGNKQQSEQRVQMETCFNFVESRTGKMIG